jgi:hypothetical protein
MRLQPPELHPPLLLHPFGFPPVDVLHPTQLISRMLVNCKIIQGEVVVRTLAQSLSEIQGSLLPDCKNSQLKRMLLEMLIAND